jgi:5S rRNA maturation endonuclease (ribonuclease M5)
VTDVAGFYAALGIHLKPGGSGFAEVRCFANPQAHGHGDKNPSCGVHRETGAYNCLACGATGGAYDAAIALGKTPAQAMELKKAHDLRITDAAPKGYFDGVTPKLEPSIVATYTYCDENAELLYTVERIEPGPDGKRKTFRQRAASGVPSMAGVRRVLYHLPDVLAAIKRNETIYLVEGEKDADALIAAGYRATTMAGGTSQSAKTENMAPLDSLHGARIIIWADADDVGKLHAQRMSAYLEPIAAGVTLRVSPHAKDAHEHLADGYTLDELVDIEQVVTLEDDDAPELYPVYTLSDMRDMPPPAYTLDKLIFEGGFNVLFGQADAGKSLAAIGWSCAIATGTTWHDKQATRGTVVYITPEGTRSLSKRFDAWAQHYNLDPEPNLRLITNQLSMMNPENVVKLQETLRSIVGQGDLVVFDTLARHIAGGDENSSQDMGIFIQAVDTLRQELGVAILIVHHTGHDASRERGSSALRPSSDVFVQLKKDGTSQAKLVWERIKDDDRPTPELYRIEKVLDSVVLVPRFSGVHTPPNPAVPLDEITERVSRFLEKQPGRRATRTKIKEGTTGANASITEAIDLLISIAHANEGNDPKHKNAVTLLHEFRA